MPTGSSGTFDLALKWLDLCAQHHQNTCGQDNELGPPLLPSRVVDIGNSTSSTVFLREPPAGRRDRYICLSYCWGRSNFVKSTTATIQRHMTQGIAVTDLPRAFQDAIEIVHAFQVRYLWIDSLCIIQDSTADWEKECGRMAEVYSNSFLTIAATRAANPDESCFGTRPGPTVDSSAATTPSFPLLCRGWAYQERILAPRVLHFGPDQVIWECRDGRQCEFGKTYYFQDEVDKGEFFRRITAPPSANHQRQIRDLWRHIVVQYTAFDLTKPSDILPALSGLAERMWSSRQDEDYLAGLWSGSLIEDLLWYREDSTYNRRLKVLPIDQGRVYPRWSI
ncbi:heterokaryon incompatibility protein-domain-containing protein [Schizothecium vesticola]|uniref:Heterokaryon incompatibility protein-domain-containing protein n=1 Tax=Schizothecium vesticola TaxID=314040 RepID=A0AA40K9A8_9PEZI|nr:heterokaryon incompatibility protein-domain-containing protein [Schizothecium vesticola]